MSTVFINEFHYDNDSTDVGEFIEIAGPAGTDLTGWSIVRYNGNTPAAAVVYSSPAQLTSFTNLVIPNQSNGFGTVAISFDVNGLQNGGNDGFALVNSSGTVVQLLSYEGVFTASGGAANGLTSTDVGVAQAGSAPVGSSIELFGTGDGPEDFAWRFTTNDTPGAINNGQSFLGAPVAGITVAPTAVAVTEGGATGSFTVVLNSQPTAEVTIAVSGDAQLGASTALLTFTTANWNVAQAVTVTAVDDAAVEGAHSGTITLAAAVSTDAAYNGLAVADVGATIADNDVGITRIHTVQGSGAASMLVDQTVTVEAVVTGDFQNGDADIRRNLQGFYLQEEDADADGNPLTSEGIFVFESTALRDVQVGDIVRVTGIVQESFGLTRLNASSISVVSSGNGLPAVTEISLPAAGVTVNQNGAYQPDLEAYEGMLVTFPQVLTISEQFNLDRSNEIRLVAGDRETTFTQDNAPSVSGFEAHKQALGARTIAYDDGTNAQNQPIGTLDGFGPSYNTANAPRMGDQVTDLSGVLDYQWAGFGSSGSTWRVRSTENGENSFTRDENPRPASPPDVGGTLKVASFNVLNYFPTLNTITNDDGSNSNPADNTALGFDPRGANNAAEFARQTQKLITTLSQLDADIIGLIELENDFLAGASGNAIQRIVTELNALPGDDVWTWVNPDTRFVGGDAIAVGLIYRTDEVKIADGTTVSILDTGLIATSGRAPIAVSFEDLDSGEVFTVTVNHFKSKSSAATLPGDADQNDGQGQSNATRVAQANELAAWLASDPTGAGDEDVLIIGDLNAYTREDPIEALKDAGYISLEQPGDYSYVFDGQTGSLDHALASATLASKVTAARPWGINADEADALDYNTDFGRDQTMFDGTVPWRTSDHDPLVIGLDFTPPPATIGFDIFRTAAPNGERAGWGGQISEITYRDGTTGGANATDTRDADAPLTAEGLTLAAEDGDFAIHGVRFSDNAGTRRAGGDPLLTVVWDDTGREAAIELLRPWNGWKNLTVDSFDGSALRVENFVHVAVDLAGSRADLLLDLDGVKRAEVRTGAGDDEIEVGIDNNGGWTNIIRVDSGGGNDLVRLGAADRAYAEAVFGRSLFDTRATTEVTLGMGDDVLWGTVSARDTAIFQDARAEVLFEAIAGGVRVTTATEGVDELYGVEFAQLAGARYAIADLI